MCLHNNPREVYKLIKLSEKQDFVYGYKIVEKSRDRLFSYYRSDYQWNPGTNKSDSRINRPIYKITNIRHGIHVYKQCPILGSYGYSDSGVFYYSAVVIRLKCYLKDLIGENTNEMVFKQVSLSKKEYQQAVK